MAYFALTEDGKNFIKEVCRSEGNKLLSGTNKYPLLFTEPALYKVWTSNAKYNGSVITSSSILASALIEWFDKYANLYELDANVIAAQAYAESGYRIWDYAETSSASGICQFRMEAVYDVIVTNKFNQIVMTPEEIAIITNDIDEKLLITSYVPSNRANVKAWSNRPILHQNIIDNPEIMIKAQCRYMKYIANNCDSLTSTSLFSYSRGPSYTRKTYSEAINNYKSVAKNTESGLNEGLKYVLKIFGVLGDKTNYLNNALSSKNYKPINYYFGYDEKMGTNDNRNLKLNQPWDAFAANVEESKKYDSGIATDDIVVQTLSVDSKYKFLTSPTNYYYREATNKKQIVLHHTASGEGYANDITWWKTIPNTKNYKVSTPFIVGRDGSIIQLYSTDYWAYHLCIDDNVIKEFGTQGVSNLMLNSQAIGIELDSWGGLVNYNGNWYPPQNNNPMMADTSTKPIPNSNVVLYPNSYHGYYGFERYTDNQINALRTIIGAINKVYTSIPLKYVNDYYPNTDMWGTYNNTTQQWEPDRNALAQKIGIWTHVSYSPTKSDCHPQQELINMLRSL